MWTRASQPWYIFYVHDQLNPTSKDGQLKLCYAFDSNNCAGYSWIALLGYDEWKKIIHQIRFICVLCFGNESYYSFLQEELKWATNLTIRNKIEFIVASIAIN